MRLSGAFGWGAGGPSSHYEVENMDKLSRETMRRTNGITRLECPCERPTSTPTQHTDHAMFLNGTYGTFGSGLPPRR